MAKLNMKRIHKVTIKKMQDESPDTSHLGEYSDRRTSEFSIDRAHALDCVANSCVTDETECQHCTQPKKQHLGHGTANYILTCIETDADCEEIEFEPVECSECGECRDSWNSCEYRYFNPSFNYVNKDGTANKDNTADEIREYVRQDYTRMERLNNGGWCYIGIRAEAEIQLTKDGPFQEITSGGLWGIESDSNTAHLVSIEMEELADLSTQLHALGFSKRAIAAAFKNVIKEQL